MSDIISYLCLIVFLAVTAAFVVWLRWIRKQNKKTEEDRQEKIAELTGGNYDRKG